MRRAALMLALGACISATDVQGALDGYCTKSNGKACSGATCCPSFDCIDTQCIKPGSCLFPDAGASRAPGEPCGCTADCIWGTCLSDSHCS